MREVPERIQAPRLYLLVREVVIRCSEGYHPLSNVKQKCLVIPVWQQGLKALRRFDFDGINPRIDRVADRGSVN